jgi:choline dehydrogenase
MAETFDVIVAGAGSAGCVIAARLSEDPSLRVLLVEAGGDDRSVWVQMPSALSIPMNMPRFNWGYRSEPEPGLGGRRIACPRGRGLGGSSSINGMVYIRGNPLDYERWREEGATGWSYREVLPYFRRAETREEGADAYRGDSGPLHTRYGPMENPLYRAFIDAAAQAGYPETEDVNGYRQEGFGRMDMTVHRGRRWSTANAYLRPALARPNLAVWTVALVRRVIVENGRAVGLEVRRGAATQRVEARKEVVLALGAIGSPQVLMLSGVGPGADLAATGLPVLADRPGVGRNLQDHLEYYHQFESLQPVTLFPHLSWWRRGLIGARWLMRGTGLGATNHFEACGFVRSRPEVAYPDIQYHFLPLAIAYDGSKLADRHGFQVHVGPMRSKSRGEVRLKGPDPETAPSIRFNYMSHPDDWAEMRACIRITREIMAQPAMAPYRGPELSPGEAVQSDEQIDDFIRQHAESAYHPCGTCRMGRPDDPGSVVDPQLRVIGVDGLRVADASVMPSIITGNLNASTIMIGEKASDLIAGRPPLPASNAPFFGEEVVVAGQLA